MQELAAVLSTALAWLEGGIEETCDQPTKLTEITATIAEERPN